MHSSNLVLNDQFSGAYSRDNLVTVECEVPVSEETSGYHAQYAKDSVGWHPWHTGTVAGSVWKAKGVERQVFLSRWINPVRIVSDSEVASMYKELLSGTDVAVPDNVVTPSLLKELKKARVKIEKSGYKKEASQLINAKSLDVTAKTGSTSTSIAKVRYKDEKVKEKFSLREPVEYTKDLVALHNLTEDKLAKALKLGDIFVSSGPTVQFTASVFLAEVHTSFVYDIC